MGSGTGLFAALTLGLCLWVVVKLSLYGMFNYHLYRLSGKPATTQRERLGGLLQLESLEVRPQALIHELKAGSTVPVLPPREQRRLTLALLAIPVLALGTVSGSLVHADILRALGYPVLVISGAGAVILTHAVSVEVRLRRFDVEDCETVYTMLNHSDEDTYPLIF